MPLTLVYPVIIRSSDVMRGRRELQLSLVEEVLASQGSKKAKRFVKEFGLEEQFPALAGGGGGAKGKGMGNGKGTKLQKQEQEQQRARAERNALADAAPLPAFALPTDVVVVYVDRAELLRGCTAALSEEAARGSGLCAVDAEWEPFRSGEAPTKVSLLQIATPTHVFLVDLLLLAATDSDELQAFWRVLTREIAIIGFGLGGDLKRICHSYPQLSRCLHRVVELQRVRATADRLPAHGQLSVLCHVSHPRRSSE